MKIGSFTRQELVAYAEDHLEFYGLEINRISSVLIAQIYVFSSNRMANTFSIMDEIKYMEGVKKTTATGKESPFRGPVLSGLHKKHYMDAYFIRKNIAAHFGRKNKGFEKYKKIIEDAHEAYLIDHNYEKFINYMAHHTTVGAFEERSKKSLTGEWIVFKKYKNKNYYLTLAQHNDGDENILANVKTAYDFDFNFLDK